MRGAITYRRKYNPETCESVEVKVFAIDGTEVSEEEFFQEFPDQEIEPGEPYQPVHFKPIHSEALAYHRKQIPEARKYLDSKGLGDTEIDKAGCPVFRDRQHRRRFLKTLGKIDRASYYGY